MIDTEEWMDLLSYRQMVAAGASWAEIARLAGCDWRTARKYLAPERKRPPRYKPRPPRPKLIDAYADLIDAELRASKAQVQATTICERLVAGHGYAGSYQRVKEYVRVRRPQIAAELGIADRAAEMHRRFETPPGAQAQVAHSTQAEHAFRRKPNTVSTGSRTPRSEATRLLLRC
jgi:transposase